MDIKSVKKIIDDTAYVRTGGSAEELKCAEYLLARCEELGMTARLESFEVQMADISSATLEIDGESIVCKGYKCCGSGTVEAPLYYLRGTDKYSLSLCKDKIVMVDGYMGYWLYHDIVENGAVGFITYDGNLNYADEDIDQRELRAMVTKDVKKLLGVNINAKQAVKLVEKGAENARISIEQTESTGMSHNVIADIEGEGDETIILTAHYDSTSLSKGSYDNMSGSIGILGVGEYFAKAAKKPGRNIRLVFCGSEERGLLGSKAYCEAHKSELDKIALNINLDMIGCIMGKFIGCCSTEEALCKYIEYMGDELGFGISCRQDVYSSDSTPFADNGVPSLSFARLAPPNTATIHNRYDTPAVMSPRQTVEDIAFIAAFADRMANAVRCPVDRAIPEKVKEKLDIYNCRKRAPKN
ncbi:MAG: Zn-dependent exopeptidase M28 [Ruminococcaceae bacterium]|nr:Zn-dependent exopeptidase M28 [Oscillospiraceae bacterium]